MVERRFQGDGTVGKALDLVDRVAAAGQPVRFSSLLEQCGLPKATLHRFLRTLVNQGMLAYDGRNQTYFLGLRLVRLAHAAWRQSSLAPIARPFLDKLATEVGETIHLAQLDSGQVLYVDKRNASVPVTMFSQAGKVGPSYCTGVGKALLAFLGEPELSDALKTQSFYQFTPATLISETSLRAELADIRRAGVAYDREEHEVGIICIAVPILSDRDVALGALSVTTSTQRSSLKALGRYRAELDRCAGDIATAAADWHFPV